MGAEPYTDVATHVRDELRRVWLRLEYQSRLGWRKETAVGGEEVVGPEDIGRLFSIARGAQIAERDSGAEQVLEQWLAAHEHTEARIRATLDERIRSPLVDVIRTFNLSQRQWSTLAFALLPEIDPNLVQGYRYLARDATVRGRMYRERDKLSTVGPLE